MNIADLDLDELLAKAWQQAKREDGLPAAVHQANPTSVLFEDFIDREQAQMPRSYLPAAPGALIAGGTILSATGYRPGCRRPRGWKKRKLRRLHEVVARPNARSLGQRVWRLLGHLPQRL